MPLEDMTQTERERLAARLVREQRTRFSGVAKNAYTAADVNPETWRRVTHAETIKPHKLIQIVVRLWPETAGDWRLIPDLDPSGDPALDAEIDDLRHMWRATQERTGLTGDELRKILESETG